jgi:hypothetical protein
MFELRWVSAMEISLRDTLAKSNRRTNYDEFNEFASNDTFRGTAHS